MDTSPVRIQYLEVETIDRHAFVALGQVSKMVDDKTANRVELFIAEVAAKMFVEILDGR